MSYFVNERVLNGNLTWFFVCVSEGAHGGFDSTDMAALGATLGVLLFLALVIMTLLFCRLRRENKDWKKIYESNVFRSSVS